MTALQQPLVEVEVEAEAEAKAQAASDEKCTATIVTALDAALHNINNTMQPIIDGDTTNPVKMAAVTYNNADTLIAEGKTLRHSALVGLAGYICGNRSLQSGIEFLAAIKDKSRIKARDMLEVYLGWHSGKDNKGAYIRKRQRIYQIEKDVISINAESVADLKAATRKERAIAWQELCAKRPGKNEEVKITDPLPDDPAKTEIDKLKKFVKGIAGRERKRGASASSVKLGLLIDALCQCGLDLEEPVLSYEDRKVFATSANFNGKPKTPKQ